MVILLTSWPCQTTTQYFSQSVFYIASKNAKGKKNIEKQQLVKCFVVIYPQNRVSFHVSKYRQPNNLNNSGGEKCSTQLSLLWSRALTRYTCDLWFPCFAVFLCQISIVIMTLAWFGYFLVCKLHISDHLLST